MFLSKKSDCPEYDRKWLAIFGMGRTMAVNDSKWPNMAGNGWKHLEMAHSLPNMKQNKAAGYSDVLPLQKGKIL